MGKCLVFMLSLCRQTDGQRDGRTDRRTTVKQYAADLSIRGIKNIVNDGKKFSKYLADIRS